MSSYRQETWACVFVCAPRLRPLGARGCGKLSDLYAELRRWSAARFASGRVVAAWVPGVAPRDATKASAESFPCAVLLDRFHHVTATARLEPARRAQEWAEGDLINADRPDQARRRPRGLASAAGCPAR